METLTYDVPLQFPDRKVKKLALPNVDIVTVDTWKPAFKIHAGCGGTLNRAKDWNYPPCKKCKVKVNSHTNAAKMLVKYHLSSS